MSEDINRRLDRIEQRLEALEKPHETRTVEVQIIPDSDLRPRKSIRDMLAIIAKNKAHNGQ